MQRTESYPERPGPLDVTMKGAQGQGYRLCGRGLPDEDMDGRYVGGLDHVGWDGMLLHESTGHRSNLVSGSRSDVTNGKIVRSREGYGINYIGPIKHERFQGGNTRIGEGSEEDGSGTGGAHGRETEHTLRRRVVR